MIEKLFKFIHVLRSRDGFLHLSALKDIISGIMSMDRIKYRRMLPVYLVDMKQLQERDPEVLKFMQDGDFSL